MDTEWQSNGKNFFAVRSLQLEELLC